MKTLEEQIKEVLERLDNIENNLTEHSEFEPCCVAECDCGCVEPETEVNDDEPSLDTVIDTPEPEEHKFTFTESELVDFATRLVQNTLASVQETLKNTDMNNDDHVSLELNWNNTIEIELDGERIKKDIMSDIEYNVSLDTNDILDEISDILSDMEAEKTYPEK